MIGDSTGAISLGVTLVLDSTTEETEVYVDKDGNVVGKPEDGINTVGTSGITLETDATKKDEEKQQQPQQAQAKGTSFAAGRRASAPAAESAKAERVRPRFR